MTDPFEPDSVVAVLDYPSLVQLVEAEERGYDVLCDTLSKRGVGTPWAGLVKWHLERSRDLLTSHENTCEEFHPPGKK